MSQTTYIPYEYPSISLEEFLGQQEEDIEKASQDPSTRSTQYKMMMPRWDIVDSLLGGTESMRRAAKNYLPQHPGESNQQYKERLGTSTLFNMTDITLNRWVGLPFSKPVVLSEDTPTQIRALDTNIDGSGTDLGPFLRNWLRDGIAYGQSHVMVDFPRLDVQGRTLADDLREGVRPYWVPINPRNVIFAHSETINGADVLTHVRIWKRTEVLVGFTHVFVNQIWSYSVTVDGVVVQIFEERDTNRKEKEWVLIDQYTYGLPFIPLITFYSGKENFFLSKSPLLDLSYLNIKHWQSESDHQSALTVARFPILASKGVNNEDDQTTTIGPRVLLKSAEPDGEYYYVEHSGQALSVSRQDILDLEENMASYGSEFLKDKPGTVTATARTLDSAEATSHLQQVVMDFTESVNLALRYTAEWLNLPNSGTVSINTDFDIAGAIEDFNLILEMRRDGVITNEESIAEAKRRGILSHDFRNGENVQPAP